MGNVKFGVPLSDDYLTDEDQGVIETNFNKGMMQQQKTMRGSKMDGERASSDQSAGLNQPVANGTKERQFANQ